MPKKEIPQMEFTLQDWRIPQGENFMSKPSFLSYNNCRICNGYEARGKVHDDHRHSNNLRKIRSLGSQISNAELRGKAEPLLG